MNTTNKNYFKYLIIITTLVLIFVCSIELLNTMITYKYHIEENFDHKEMIISYKERKIEIERIIVYLKIFITYFILIVGYLSYQIISKKNEKLKK